jgi:hypothetical protein
MVHHTSIQQRPKIPCIKKCRGFSQSVIFRGQISEH